MVTPLLAHQYGVIKSAFIIVMYFTAYVVHNEYCTRTNYSYNNYYEQQLLRNSALDFLKQPLVTVERSVYMN